MPYTAQYSSDEPSRPEVEAMPGLTLLEFGTDWCPHCQAIQPLLRELLTHEVRHLKIEDGKGRRLGRAFGVKLWPNLVWLADGQIQQQLARPQTSDLRAAFQAFKTSR
ncbi:thioredoxin family protein [bacterium]|nr:thioredoxin family protein [bacterium]